MQDSIYHYDIYFFSILIVVFTLYSTYKNTKFKNITNTIFAFLGIVLIITLIAEALGWLIDKTESPYLMKLNIIVNMLIYAITPLNAFLLTLYLHSIIFTYTKLSKKWAVFSIPLLINLAITITNPILKLYFYVDETNTYHRASFFYVMVLISYTYIVFFIIYLFVNKKQVKRNDFYAFLVLMLFPITGGIIQTLYYGVGLIWPFFSITYMGFNLIIQQAIITNDYLTGIKNRGSLDRELEIMITTAKIKNSGFFGVMFDLDYFKEVNDTYGHSEGDELLKAFSNILSATFRRSECVARLGGDEFMVLIEHYDNFDINNILKRLNENIRNFNETSQKPWKIAMSCGVLYFDPKLSMDRQIFYKKIDEQLYNDKKKHRKSMHNNRTITST